MFPRQIAGLLGVDGDLVTDAAGAVGVEGGGFPTWSYQPGLTGQVVRTPPNNPTQRELRGPTFPMTPAFAEKDAFLLGRQDFFRALQVDFEPGKPIPHFVIQP